MRNISYILISIIMVLLGVFFLVETWSYICVHFKAFTDNAGKTGHNWWFLWVLLGGLVYPLINYFVDKKENNHREVKVFKNIGVTKTFMHEMSHAIVAVLTFRRIHSFHVTEVDGVVYSSGSEKTRFLVSLAPYCFLWLTFPFISLRCIVENGYLWIMDILIGITIGLHAVCIKEDTGNHQSDITKYPVVFSYIYIFSVLLFDLSLILMSYKPESNIFYAFRDYVLDFWGYVSMLWS